MWRRIRHIIIKEFIQVFRDRKLRFFLIVPPLVQLLAYGYTYRCKRLALIYPHHPEMKDWTLPRFTYCSPAGADIVLQIAAFDLDAPRSAAEQLLDQQI